MASSKDLYSYKGEEPQPLPNEIFWICDDGYLISRTGIESFTEEEILKAGYKGPFKKPSYYEKQQKLLWDSDNLTYIVENLYEPEPIVEDTEPQSVIITEEMFWDDIRRHRDILLLQSDWAVNDSLVDVNLTENQRNKWIEYREKLRDLPLTISYSLDLVSDRTYPSNLRKFFPESPKK